MTDTTHGAQARESGSRTLSIIAMVCGAVAVLFLPIIFGPLGIVVAIVAAVRHERWWMWGAAVAVIGMVLGMVLSYLVLSGGL